MLNAEQALLCLTKASLPDLILLDIKMPEMNGFQLCEQLKSENKTRNIPIIFISAMSDVDDILQGFSVGGADYITKPFHDAEVLARVNTQIALRNQQIQLEVKNAKLEAEISRRKQTEKELRKAKEEADRANQSKSIFLSNISHELRTPLNSIIGFANLLANDTVRNDDQREFSQIIERSGQSLLTLINELLDIEKIEAGKVELIQKDFCLSELLNEVIDLMRVTADTKHIELILEMDEKLPSYVYADPDRLSQVLLNLVNNAIKFTEKGAVTLRVFNFQTCEDTLKKFTTIIAPSEPVHHQELIVFEIEDTGIGIADEHYESIFQPFEQTGSQRYRLQGTGLGLHICTKWIEKMNGHLHLYSQPGKGSIFRVDLHVPISQNHSAQRTNIKIDTRKTNHQKSNVIISENNSIQSPQNRKIVDKGSVGTVLIVDDTPAHYHLLTLMLISHNLETITADTGIEAIELAKQNTPDIILLDMMMPQMDGAETIKRLRIIPGMTQTPIIAVSSVIRKDKHDDCAVIQIRDDSG
ncbi:MAG: histidine kinase [Candidatus Magnetoglobus multicellularis str. Araruama]|uniref:histidine kinase n=1 Tax=Candidatus Magnetoglobus multicellularis str. Araruama TaxID=890399 RepID=A0A1V1P6Y5_9BACT|nr:MAG: histidine kinase [Candidatus Magnetoglobus multicellularis str. Araruama]